MSTTYPISRRRHAHSLTLYIYIHIQTGKTYEHRVPDDEAHAEPLFTVTGQHETAAHWHSGFTANSMTVTAQQHCDSFRFRRVAHSTMA